MNDWNISDAYSNQKCDLIALMLETSLYDTLNKQPSFARSIQKQRQKLMQTHGLFIPAIRIKKQSLEKNRYMIYVRGQRAGDGIVYPTRHFTTEQTEGTTGVHPVSNKEGVWVEGDGDGQTAQDIILSHLLTIMERKAPELLTFETTSLWWQQARSHVPNLLKELEKHGVTIGLLWQVMQKMLQKRIPLHPFEDLLETILEYYIVHPPHGYAPPEWTHAHPDEIVKYIASQKKKRLPPPEQSFFVVHHLKRQ